jgi:hypothetical protein
LPPSALKASLTGLLCPHAFDGPMLTDPRDLTDEERRLICSLFLPSSRQRHRTNDRPRSSTDGDICAQSTTESSRWHCIIVDMNASGSGDQQPVLVDRKLGTRARPSISRVVATEDVCVVPFRSSTLSTG